MNVCGKRRLGGFDRVERERCVTCADQLIYDMPADESARACHENSHGYVLIWAL